MSCWVTHPTIRGSLSTSLPTDVMEVSTSSISFACTSGTSSLKDVERLQVPKDESLEVTCRRFAPSFPSQLWSCNSHGGKRPTMVLLPTFPCRKEEGTEPGKALAPKELLDSPSSQQLLNLSLFHATFHLPSSVNLKAADGPCLF